MSKAIFNYNGIETTIQCKNDQTMKDICQKFSTKIQINLDKLLFLYNGKIIDFDLSFEKQANSIDLKNNNINILAYEYNDCNEKKLNEMGKNKKLTDENIRDIMEEDLVKKGKELLSKHLDGRNYIEDKVEEWIKNILDEYEKYFKEKYPSYNLFMFCSVCSKSTYFNRNKASICVSSKEESVSSIFKTDDIFSCLDLFFFKAFKSIPNFSIEPKIISFGNKLLYEIFDERKYDSKMDNYCKRFNDEFESYFLKLDRKRRVLDLTYAFKKPMKNFSYLYKAISRYHLSKIIQTFITRDAEIYHYSFIFSNDNENISS